MSVLFLELLARIELATACLPSRFLHQGGLSSVGGSRGVRTLNPRLAKPMLFQLSYAPDGGDAGNRTPTFAVRVRRASVVTTSPSVRSAGIEPAYLPRQGSALPLSYVRVLLWWSRRASIPLPLRCHRSALPIVSYDPSDGALPLSYVTCLRRCRRDLNPQPPSQCPTAASNRNPSGFNRVLYRLS